MTDVKLIPVVEENYREVIKLGVAEHQKKFVAPNIFSIAQAYIYHDLRPMAIVANEKIVGFVMYGMEPDI